jgi:hypothetical protein
MRLCFFLSYFLSISSFLNILSSIASFHVMSKRKFDLFCQDFQLNSDVSSSLHLFDQTRSKESKEEEPEIALSSLYHCPLERHGKIHPITKPLPPSQRRLASSSCSSSSSGSLDLSPSLNKDLRKELLKLRPFPSIRPSFKHQVVYSSTGIYPLDSVNTVTLCNDFFSKELLQNYLSAAASVERFSGKSAFNSIKPRKEVCYTVDGEAFRYSRILHRTTKYPSHVLSLMPYFQEYVQRCFPVNKYQKISGSLDIVYSAEFERGKKVWSLSLFLFDHSFNFIFQVEVQEHIAIMKWIGDLF